MRTRFPFTNPKGGGASKWSVSVGPLSLSLLAAVRPAGALRKDQGKQNNLIFNNSTVIY